MTIYGAIISEEDRVSVRRYGDTTKEVLIEALQSGELNHKTIEDKRKRVEEDYQRALADLAEQERKAAYAQIVAPTTLDDLDDDGDE